MFVVWFEKHTKRLSKWFEITATGNERVHASNASQLNWMDGF